ncbi:hypothetical protein Clacol_009426 [Clathrus columnatus]|uniref:Uncharacterized protein n=1 Tax=Clathrus columnatus TaxID=1419009 RepID=A0AAV5AKG3_9AGAM|nr:hypothetical protein Clacol_009426 [Clathrus columnatus]
MSSNSNNQNNTSAGLPPFIPGLLIVSLLVVMSLLVAWRNYIRRNRFPQHVDSVGPEWPARWETITPVIGPTPRGPGKRLEKPQMLEVDGVPNRDVMSMKGLQWDDVMPLSVTTLDSKGTIQDIQQHVLTEDPPVYLAERERSTSSLRFQLPRLPFFSRPTRSSTVTTDGIERISSLPDPTVPTSNLQVSLMISMPSPHFRTYHPSEENPTFGTGSFSEKAVAHPDFQMFEGVPEVALGVAVVPLRPTFDDRFDDEKEK